ncbi:hypothetical protein FOC4_g10001421 [Fusarium odoratissimum]|uniref:Mitochondrial import inner membrane translocase subunit TIM22 n=1 Tax=Fusarium oxysporum f. sp. cubense (strain race 4) TaxID=2502994 RepID=N1S5L4_FUSC4|nr:hypothetical protein FOC4_g10001421 [Fusarium odoratissimum]
MAAAPSPTLAPSPRPGAPMPSDLTFPQDTNPRLSIATPMRLMLGTISSAVVGFSLGATQGGQMAQLRFRAEHAHKMPDTTTGWYFYHKSKNYHAMQGGIREGFRMGLKTGFWSFLALSLESTNIEEFGGGAGEGGEGVDEEVDGMDAVLEAHRDVCVINISLGYC